MPKTRKKILSIPIALTLLILLVGFFARVHHWPFGFEIKFLGLTSLGILYMARYATKEPKTIKDTSKVLMVLSWVLFTTLGLFKLGYTPYLVYLSLILGLFWLILEIIDVIKPKSSNNKINPVLWIGIILMILFVLIKILHWPFGSIVYLFGLLISSMGFIIDYFLNRKESR